ncbi:MAG: glycosyltransferase family 1 protein [Pseudomonadota bacterium]
MGKKIDMRIGVNTLSILPGENGGGETYLVNLLREISNLDKNSTYCLFVNKENQKLFPEAKNFTRILCPVSKGNVALRVLWEQFILPFYLISNKIDVLFSPANMAPVLWCPCKSVLTIHDLIWTRYGENLPRKQFYALKYLTNRSAVKATKIMADSGYTKTDLLARVKTDNNKITVVHLGVGDLIGIRSDYSNDQLLAKIGGGFLLSVGRTHPHKNFLNLIEAFKVLKGNNKNFNRKLVIAGLPGMQHEQINNKICDDNLGGDIFLLGNVSNDDLALLYRKAELFIFPSLCEGFGLPILEAMSFGLPVACSNAACLPEIGGEAALYFDPLKVADLADKIYDILSSENFKRELISKGYQHIKGFSWKKTAERAVKVFIEAAGIGN